MKAVIDSGCLEYKDLPEKADKGQVRDTSVSDTSDIANRETIVYHYL